ncbi:conjugal transfer protein TrbC [Salmonella enterica subsp. enterica]|uniref:Conjugal transfer protein TrbC n=1 Tax=Salmonella enterica subsp. enterica serovar Aqua TaxID=1302615 RepID=A0A5X6EQ67_SALET|nr:conjugal transfer protein TrbC [Salmonella enterica subsp. enterica serovar Aqua]ECM3182376.1 TraM recognition domain-containing protein [Salmonella enterica subsp. enterica serovar Newport]ECT3983498.1 conjugal transfer protein TrbC [Salmonella enterica subsp. houtenae serovar 53:z4,z23:-]EEF3248635.1 TraM recognition domain-containing protein [Salmonella enterica]EEI9429957.1 TraM recognition domain-containing protein [Salmonella enterica subsp. diarizonae]MCH5484361.1 TraG/TraD/VirD4 fam
METGNTRPVDKARVRQVTQSTWIDDWLLAPVTVQAGLVVILVLTFLRTWILIPGVFATAIWLLTFFGQVFRMPLRMPKDIGGIDMTTERENAVEFKGLMGLFRFTRRKLTWEKSAGIMCLGHARRRFLGRELWLTRDDCLRHMQLLATTGSGKTEALLSLQLNSICMGRGMTFSDGKAETRLAYAIWSLMRRYGQEDNYYVLNFLNGGRDRFDELLGNDRTRPQSNSTNFFGDATATFIIQLMESLLPQVGTSEAGWQDKARPMLYGLVYALYYKCKKENIRLSQSLIQKHLPLRKLAGLYIEGRQNGWHDEALNALEAYLSTLAGFRMELISRPSEWDQGVYDQHGFLIQQFSRMLAMFNDVYGHIFSSDAGDIDIRDVLHNDRTLVVLIPALELSKSESANLGKLYISAKRMVIARDLGYQLEGKRKDVLISKKFWNPFPYPDVHDELGSYFAPGMDDLAAQMRSLGLMLVISAQDIQRFVSQFKGEYQTVNANTLVKWFMALQDEKDTFELAKATAGKDYYAELGEMKRTPGTVSSSYEEANTTYIREKNRITLDELKDLNPGEGFISFKSALVPGSAIYIPDDEKLSSKLELRINRFIDVGTPTEADLIALNPNLSRLLPPSEMEISMVLQRTDEIVAGSDIHTLPPLMDPILARLAKVTMDLDNRSDISYTPAQRGILLFEAARDVLRQRGKKWFTVKTQPNQLNVSDAMARRLASQSTAFTPKENQPSSGA